MIEVTKPFLPPKDEYDKYLAEIWKRNWLTNNGPLVKRLELELKNYFGLENLIFTANGTLALQLAIKALNVSGEVITTPFSYIATTSSLVWEGCVPRFVDIDSETLNIDSTRIEAAITDKTSAILATHVFGNPCKIDQINEIAASYDLKVIYDAAHCFGSKYQGQSVLRYGDVSAISFHATKLFHTIEGGAIITKDPNLLKRTAYLRNFGHDGFDRFNGVGINAKNSEIHAAMGLVNLKYVDHILAKRKQDCQLYFSLLNELGLPNIKVEEDAVHNYSYFPIIFESEEQCLKIFNLLKAKEVFSRRYFYPALSSLDYVSSSPMPVAESIAGRILCLPLYEQLTRGEIEFVCEIILDGFRAIK